MKYDCRSCFDIVNPAQYRDACDHAVAADTPAGACIIANAYHIACYKQGVVSTRIPASCSEFSLNYVISMLRATLSTFFLFLPFFDGVAKYFSLLLSASCKVGANKVDVGDTFSVKIPKKEADVIFVVEQQTPNEKIYKELVVPLMSELRTELKQHGVT